MHVYLNHFKICIFEKQPIKYDRNLVVKKLIEEEEFLPCYAKTANKEPEESNSEHSFLLESSHSRPSIRQQQPVEPRVREYHIPVEVIGTNTVGHPFQQHIQNQKIFDTAKTPTNNRGTKKVEFKTFNSKQPRPQITLDEKNYKQLVDNLTQKYTETALAAKLRKELEQQNQQNITSLYVNMTNNLNTNNSSGQVKTTDKVTLTPQTATNDKLVSFDYFTDLGVNGIQPSNAVKTKLTHRLSQTSNKPSLGTKKKQSPSFFKTNTKLITNKTENPKTNHSLTNNTVTLSNPNQQKGSFNIIQNTLDTNTTDPFTFKDNEGGITINSFHSTDNGNDLPGTPQTYSSYTNSFMLRRPLIQNYNSRAKLCINSPSSLGYLNSYGQCPQLNALGGGFYYSTSKKKPLPSGYYQYNSAKRETMSKSTSSCRIPRASQEPTLIARATSFTDDGTETKYFNISRPLKQNSQLCLSSSQVH